MLFGRHVTVALGVVIIACEGVEAANRFEKADQIGWGSLCHDIDIDRQPSYREDPQEEAGTTLELKGEPAFSEMSQKLEGNDGFLQHDGVWASQLLGLELDPIPLEAVSGNHEEDFGFINVEFLEYSSLMY